MTKPPPNWETGGALQGRIFKKLQAIESESPEASSPSTDETVDRTGQRVGAFELREKIGTGGMGVVYRAERIEGGFRQEVAIKLISSSLPHVRDRFERERQILAELRHPNIAQLVDGGETQEGTPYFAMEYVSGKSLTEHIACSQLKLEQRLQLLIKVASALEYAHKRNVLHRDIKPSNVLVSADGAVKLLDFGIAKLLDAPTESTLTQLGWGPMTPDYAAPEQFMGDPLTFATDIYQLGVLIFKVIVGRSPYRRSETQSELRHSACNSAILSLQEALQARNATEISHGQISPISGEKINARVADLNRIILKCLARNPKFRYQSVHALIGDLEAILAKKSPGVSRRMRLKRLIIGVLAMAVVAGAFKYLPRLKNESIDSPTLTGLGLTQAQFYLSDPSKKNLILEALNAEANGDMTTAVQALEAVHSADPTTPIPALILSHQASAYVNAKGRLAYWKEQAEKRINATGDPTLQLLWRYFEEDSNRNYEDALRYSKLLLDVHPDAWFLRLGRAHLLKYQGFDEAALSEIKRINPRKLNHRKLVTAIADRASMGDIDGARAQLDGIASDPGNPYISELRFRISYTSGELEEALRHAKEVVRIARATAKFGLETKLLIYVGTLQGALAHYDDAAMSLYRAKQQLLERNDTNGAIDLMLTLAQLASLRGDKSETAREIEEAGKLLYSDSGISAQVDEPTLRPMHALFSARLLDITPDGDAGSSDVERSLILAHIARIANQPAQAKTHLKRAREQGVEQMVYLEEYSLLARMLGETHPDLPAIDPPFSPYARFASRWALGLGSTVAPARLQSQE